jgi:uncharacterized protein (TIGR04255 family)
MPSVKLPSKLGREPIVDVISELRFQGAPGVAGVLPGLLFSKLDGVESIEPLPVAQLPEAIRAADPNLRYMPITRLHWKQFLVLIGPHSVAMACKLPYAGWESFKPAILRMYEAIRGVPLVGQVEQCSLKYTNLFEKPIHDDTPFNTFNIALRVGKNEISQENSNLRVELKRGAFLHAISMATEARATLMGSTTARVGALLDVDSLAQNLNMKLDDYISIAPKLLQDLHDSNHELFFECISESTLKKLEPRYE